MPCTEGRWPPVIRSAVFTTLCRALRSAAEQLPYKAVMRPERMLSMVPLLQFFRVLADMRDFLSLLKKYARFWAVLTACMDQDCVPVRLQNGRTDESSVNSL